MEHLASRQPVQRRERLRRDQIVDRRPDGPRAVNAFRQAFGGNLPARAVRLAKKTAFQRQRSQLQNSLYFVGSHVLETITNQPWSSQCPATDTKACFRTCANSIEYHGRL